MQASTQLSLTIYNVSLQSNVTLSIYVNSRRKLSAQGFIMVASVMEDRH